MAISTHVTISAAPPPSPPSPRAGCSHLPRVQKTSARYNYAKNRVFYVVFALVCSPLERQRRDIVVFQIFYVKSREVSILYVFGFKSGGWGGRKRGFRPPLAAQRHLSAFFSLAPNIARGQPYLGGVVNIGSLLTIRSAAPQQSEDGGPPSSPRLGWDSSQRLGPTSSPRLGRASSQRMGGWQAVQGWRLPAVRGWGGTAVKGWGLPTV